MLKRRANCLSLYSIHSTTYTQILKLNNINIKKTTKNIPSKK